MIRLLSAIHLRGERVYAAIVPRGFQAVFFRFLTSACDRGKPFQMDKDCLKTPVFSSILVPSALVDPGHPLNTPI